MPTAVTPVARVVLLLLAAWLSGFRLGHAQQAGGGDGTPQEQLWDAARAGDTLALGQALAAGAKIDSLDTRRTPNGRRALNWAALDNRPEAIRFLVAHGATVNAWNRTGFTPLHHAAENGSLEAALALLKAGADPTSFNKAGVTPSEVARQRGHPEVATAIDSATR